MKGGKMDKKQMWIVVGIAVVVALAVSVVAAGITGGVIKVYDYNTRTYSDAYTKQEIDSKFSNVKGSCQYIHYKDKIYTGYDLSNITIMDACRNILGGFVPKIIVETESRYLYNRQNCSPSYQIYDKTTDKLISYKTELATVELGQSSYKTESVTVLGQSTSDSCENAAFPDGSSNAGFSTKTYRLYSGVLCCKN